MPRFDDVFSSVSQVVDDALNSAMGVETKISEAVESFERAINLTSGLKVPPPNDPVANQEAVRAVTNEMFRASTNDRSEVLAPDALEGKMLWYSKVGICYCCTSWG